MKPARRPGYQDQDTKARISRPGGRLLIRQMEMLLFKIDNDSYGVELDDVEEVLHMPLLRHIPSAPAFITGALNLRGELLPVIDITERLGSHRPAPPPPLGSEEEQLSPYPLGTRLLVTREEREDSPLRFGVIMDGWQGISRFDPDSYRHGILNTDCKAPWINGINLGEGRMIQRIMIKNLLYEEERQLIMDNG